MFLFNLIEIYYFSIKSCVVLFTGNLNQLCLLANEFFHRVFFHMQFISFKQTLSRYLQ